MQKGRRFPVLKSGYGTAMSGKMSVVVQTGRPERRLMSIRLETMAILRVWQFGKSSCKFRNSGKSIALSSEAASRFVEDNVKNTLGPISAKLPPASKEKPIEPNREFLMRIAQECRRAERSKQRFLLVLIKGFETLQARVPEIVAPLSSAIRETDAWGWYEVQSTLGIVFVELGGQEAEIASKAIIDKIQLALVRSGHAEKLAVLVFVLPVDLNKRGEFEDGSERIYECLKPLSSPYRRVQLKVKRVIDLIGSAALLIVLFPLMAIIALAVKCSSPGPILFRQTRVGEGGKQFTFLKYRSMAVENDSSLHENYVKQFIRGKAAKNTNEKGEGVFKLTQDPRITPIGKVLRKTSLDELPQLWNVLRGEMSLVGPRPPIPYEVECYDLWHQRRVLELKPGITGLWQVRGRSRIGFDDMVRLDLQYARTWSPWLDVKILLQTPFAVFGGDGAH
jgi:lipopolysaccharide/colanic/teichoic acid biosynthesis glycosyltransferase